MKISRIFLYDEPTVPEVKIDSLARFLMDTLQVPVQVRKNFFVHFKSDRNTAYKIASTRIFDPYSPFEVHTPTEEEINYEERSFENDFDSGNIILYDGFEIQNVVKSIVPENESSQDTFHIVFTTRLGCTYDCEDYRYHGRAVICSNPAMISTTGIIEAPAKPRAYYIIMQHSMSMGLNVDSLKNKFEGKFLEYHDDKLDKVVRGYALQAIFYHITGEPFCDSRNCMLYNAHWQEDLIHGQINLGKLCEKHQRILESIIKHE